MHVITDTKTHPENPFRSADIKNFHFKVSSSIAQVSLAFARVQRVECGEVVWFVIVVVVEEFVRTNYFGNPSDTLRPPW